MLHVQSWMYSISTDGTPFHNKNFSTLRCIMNRFFMENKLTVAMCPFLLALREVVTMSLLDCVLLLYTKKYCFVQIIYLRWVCSKRLSFTQTCLLWHLQVTMRHIYCTSKSDWHCMHRTLKFIEKMYCFIPQLATIRSLHHTILCYEVNWKKYDSPTYEHWMNILEVEVKMHHGLRTVGKRGK